LRVAYLSPDFRQHSCADYLEPLLRAHDRAVLEVRLYHAWPGRDARADIFADLADAFIEVAGISDEALAARLRDDEVDVLVELAGHSGFNRLPALAWRPAPVQLAWLGYPFTTGLTRLEGRISDSRADPPGSEVFGSEPVLRLDPCYLCWQPPMAGPEPSETSGRPFTFGSFNHFAKVNGAVVEIWSELLRRVPTARLLLKGKGGADPVLRERLYRAFAARGIAPGRIEMAAFTARVGDHLAQYQCVDLALDTFPFNGVTTTLEALWMGVPVVTLAGRHSVARQGVSILGAVGLESLVAASPEAYLQLAVGLAQDPYSLKALRHGLRERLLTSPICDAQGFARRLEGLYRTLWQRACSASSGSTMEAPLEP
jgi:predicted O-linked N-acetylglucosamine transferase (SPINDLY family)